MFSCTAAQIERLTQSTGEFFQLVELEPKPHFSTLSVQGKHWFLPFITRPLGVRIGSKKLVLPYILFASCSLEQPGIAFIIVQEWQ